MKVKKHLKILAVIFAVILLLFIFLLLDNFVGNPITSTHIKNQTEALIKTEYSDYQVSSVNYDRTRKVYFVEIVSNYQTNIDDHFLLKYSRHGDLQDNFYNSSVAEKSNTHIRLSKQYNELLIQTSSQYNASDKKPDYIINFDGFFVPPKPEELESNKIYSTAELNEIAKKYGTLTVRIEHENPTLEVSADIIKVANDVLNEYGISYNNMTVFMNKSPFEKGVDAVFRFEGLLQQEITGESFIDLLETKNVIENK